MRTKYTFDQLARLNEIDVYKEVIKLPVYPEDADGNIKENVSGKEWLQFYLKNAYRELLVIAARYNLKNPKYYVPRFSWFPNKAMRFQIKFRKDLTHALQNPAEADKICKKVLADWKDVDIENNDQSPLLKKYRYSRNRIAIKQLLIFLAKGMDDEGNFQEFASDKNDNQVQFFIAYASRVKEVMLNLGVREKGYWTGMTSLLWEYSEMIKMRAVQFNAGLVHGQKWKGFYDAEAHKVQTIEDMPGLSKKQAESMTLKWVEATTQNKKYEKELQDVTMAFKKYQAASKKEEKRLQDEVVSFDSRWKKSVEALAEQKKKSANVIGGAKQSHSRHTGLGEKLKYGKDFNQIIHQKDADIARLTQEKKAWEATVHELSQQLANGTTRTAKATTYSNNDSEVKAENGQLKERNSELAKKVREVPVLKAENQRLIKENTKLQKAVEGLRSKLIELKAFVEQIYNLFMAWAKAAFSMLNQQEGCELAKTLYLESTLDKEMEQIFGSYHSIIDKTDGVIDSSEIKFEPIEVADGETGDKIEESEVSTIEEGEKLLKRADSVLFSGLEVKGKNQNSFAREIGKNTVQRLSPKDLENLNRAGEEVGIKF